MGRGRFIAFEGIDGSGKSTVCKEVSERLLKEGFNVVRTGEPTGYHTGKFLRQVLAEKGSSPITKLDGYRDAELFFADRIEHNKQLIIPSLERGEHVLSDRYFVSTLTYQPTQGVKSSYLIQKVKDLVDDGVIREPDLTLLFHVSVDTALKRLDATGKMKEKFENREFLEKLYVNQKDILKKIGGNMVEVDAEQPLDSVVESAYRIIVEEIKK